LSRNIHQSPTLTGLDAMKPSASRKVWQLPLFLFGVFLIAAGFSAGFVAGSWVGVPVVLMVAGGFALLLWLGSQRNLGGMLGKRSTQVGTNAIAATVAMVVLLGVVNFLAVNYTGRLDLTENQRYTLAPETQELVRNLDRPVQVLIFDRNLNPSDHDLLDRYQALNPAFGYELVNPEQQFGRAQEFQVTNYGEVYLEAGERRQRLDTVPFDGQTRLNEVELTNAIAQVTSDRSDTIYFLQGHGERPIANSNEAIIQAISALEAKNFTSEALNLGSASGIPDNAALVAVVGPQRSLFPEEVTALGNYLDQGGSLLLLLDPESDGGLQPLLDDWGVTLDPRLVIDASGEGQLVGLGPDVPLVTDYGDHPITASFRNGISFYPRVRPVDWAEQPGLAGVTLMSTNDQSWAESDPTAERLEFNPASDRQGPLGLGVAVERTPEAARPEGDTPEGDTPEAETPEGETPEAETPEAETPEGETPEAETPEAETPEGETPEAETPEGETPEAETPEGETPEAETPEGETPEAETPEGETPEAETPEVGEPEGETPEAEETAANDGQATNEAAADTPADAAPMSARLVVIGDSDFAADGRFGQQLNGDVLVNAVSWLSDRDESTLSIRPREATERRITLVARDQSLLALMSVILLPLLGFGSAALLWWQRR
jgi:ABC-type uncharacterized transport system involved in gliding motility auxiliary subunit